MHARLLVNVYDSSKEGYLGSSAHINQLHLRINTKVNSTITHVTIDIYPTYTTYTTPVCHRLSSVLRSTIRNQII